MSEKYVLPPNTIGMMFRNDKPMLVIHPDGMVEIDSDLTYDEAAIAFWKAVEFFAPADLRLQVRTRAAAHE